jgi:hypothetical protein
VSDDCERPLDLNALVDYWLEDVASPERDRVEEHLLGCDGCSERLRALATLGESVRQVAHQGLIQVVVSPSFIAKATREGLRTREYRVPPGGSVACTVTPEDDLLVGRLRADFKGVSRLDVVTNWEGRPEERIEDVPFSPDAPELIIAQPMPAMRALGHSVLRVRLLAQEEGGERLVGDYTFAHAPTRR